MAHAVSTNIFLDNWQRKLVALLSAIVIWWFVHNSITETKTIPNVPIRIVNLPANKTVVGLLPNRLLSKRVTLTVTGTKDVIREIEPGDLEILLDLSQAESDDWIVHIGKKNLVSLNPSLDILRYISNVSHSDFVLRLSPLINAQIPINILSPIGEAPEGYQFLDVWPKKLTQTVSAAEEEMQTLQDKGITLQLNLNQVAKSDLDALKEDEFSFIVPQSLKQVSVNGSMEEINDPDAKMLRLDFLRKNMLPIQHPLPIRVFYPLKESENFNAKTHPLATGDLIEMKNGIYTLQIPLFVKNVSPNFLELIEKNMEVTVIAEASKEPLKWSVEILNPAELEERYISSFMEEFSEGPLKEQYRKLLTDRFCYFLKNLELYVNPTKKLSLKPVVSEHSIEINK